MSLNKQKLKGNIDEERIILSKSISGNASNNISLNMSNNISANDSNGIFLKKENKPTIFSKLNKGDTSNAGLLQKSFSKSFKEDESINKDEDEEAEKELERGDILRDDRSRRLIKKEKIVF